MKRRAPRAMTLDPSLWRVQGQLGTRPTSARAPSAQAPVMSRQDTVGEFGIGPGSNRQTVRTAQVSSQFGPAPAQLDLPLTPSWEFANGIPSRV
jgi:hypothetical protein